MFNLPATQLLTATLIAAIMGISGFLIGPTLTTTPPMADMHLEPIGGTVVIGETFVIEIMVESQVPVNVFKGLLRFDPDKLRITNIDYNTSIADLWAEQPWYSNGAGTLNFIGGTSRAGGFTGHGSLITITFTSTATGEAKISMDEIKIIQHDGLGTETQISEPIDAIFAVSSEELQTQIILDKTITGPSLTVVEAAPSTDLNGDGKRGIADISIFMTDLARQDKRSDFNQDGSVDLKDLSILTK